MTLAFDAHTGIALPGFTVVPAQPRDLSIGGQIFVEGAIRGDAALLVVGLATTAAGELASAAAQQNQPALALGFKFLEIGFAGAEMKSYHRRICSSLR